MKIQSSTQGVVVFGLLVLMFESLAQEVIIILITEIGLAHMNIPRHKIIAVARHGIDVVPPRPLAIVIITIDITITVVIAAVVGMTDITAHQDIITIDIIPLATVTITTITIAAVITIIIIKNIMTSLPVVGENLD